MIAPLIATIIQKPEISRYDNIITELNDERTPPACSEKELRLNTEDRNEFVSR